MIRVVFIFLFVTAFVALAQDETSQESTTQDSTAVTVNVLQSEEYGDYLTDAEGNSLYLFMVEDMESTDPEQMTEGVRSNVAPCADQCLEFWPPLTASEVTAGEGVDAELLYTADVNGMTMVVYNGWPLYHFAKDENPGDTNGQGSGQAPNIWYLVSPEGTANETGAE